MKLSVSGAVNSVVNDVDVDVDVILKAAETQMTLQQLNSFVSLIKGILERRRMEERPPIVVENQYDTPAEAVRAIQNDLSPPSCRVIKIQKSKNTWQQLTLEQLKDLANVTGC